MKQLNKLIDHVANRVNINLREPLVDVRPYIKDLLPEDSFALYYAFYSLTNTHPLMFNFRHSSIGGTYFLGKCKVNHSILYKSDIRGDELKRKGSIVEINGQKIKLRDDEVIKIRDSFLMKTLVHNNSHDPENLECFKISNTVSLHYANIHGTSVEGCFLEPFSSVDLSICHDCAVGAYSYVQAGELSHKRIKPGRVWVKSDGAFEFNYQFPKEVLSKYIRMENNRPKGIFMDFFDERKEDFVPIYSSVKPEALVFVPDGASVSPYAVIKGNCKVAKNVLVAQRAYIENSDLGPGANAQENCYIINSEYEGNDVTAHGGKVIYCCLGKQVFVGFNSFLNGKENAKIEIGSGSIIMPHTIIDSSEPIKIPDNSLVWGYVSKQEDLEMHSILLSDFAAIKGQFRLGNLTFEGIGSKFVDGFRHRIEHILECNGAFWDGSEETAGHSQQTQDISFNILQPYPEGDLQGLYPELTIDPLVPSDL
ncbi:transferase [Maridesulfovibrio sp.]|jgi:carbonic anhydrase/acetyltransferase-like protein (isoleucine patch superfamily)|uniref:transferase n=1 Tax=Maridesulfovibrio sp. TaxID=2795000 RepID=UPI0029CA4400|nr:transferase [Maridesulfovibrio sp.]